jgi:hypothetical protein
MGHPGGFESHLACDATKAKLAWHSYLELREWGWAQKLARMFTGSQENSPGALDWRVPYAWEAIILPIAITSKTENFSRQPCCLVTFSLKM